MPASGVRHPWGRRRRKERGGRDVGEVARPVGYTQEGNSQQRGVQRLPILVHETGRPQQCVWDGRRVKKVGLNDHLADSGPFRPEVWWSESVARLQTALHETFVPDQVRPQYMHYMNWKCLHRVVSSVLQVHCTQAMLRAIGIGAKRTLPTAAGLNWVLKDGLGRLGKLTYTASLSRTFDSDLKRVRFSTSVLFTLSLGLEILTPYFPRHFLLMATMANVGKSISYAAYLATTSAIHRSFALADNLSDISAKGQVQTVVCDNLGLAIAVGLNHYYKSNARVGKLGPLAFFPVLAGADLFAIYHELRAVHLPSLNKVRLELIVDTWLKRGVVPSIAEVNNVETSSLVYPANSGRKQASLKIGPLNLRRWRVDDLLTAVQLQDHQRYIICQENHELLPFVGTLGGWKPGLSIWLHKDATAKDIITGVLQACHLRNAGFVENASHEQLRAREMPPPNHLGRELEGRESDSEWKNLFDRSRSYAEANVNLLLAQMEGEGWQAKRILLNPWEKTTYSTLARFAVSLCVRRVFNTEDWKIEYGWRPNRRFPLQADGRLPNIIHTLPHLSGPRFPPTAGWSLHGTTLMSICAKTELQSVSHADILNKFPPQTYLPTHFSLHSFLTGLISSLFTAMRSALRPHQNVAETDLPKLLLWFH